MRFWPSDNRESSPGGGRLFRQAVFVFAFTGVSVAAQSAKPVAKTTVMYRTNEYTLAGLRPGKDTLTKAKHLYSGSPEPRKEDDQATWSDLCRKKTLILTYDEQSRIETIRVGSSNGSPNIDCSDKPERVPWRTGHGLALDDSTTKLVQLYGEPDSKSPSTRDGQPLELWYYAFDWAGPDVPQVMEVLCTRGQNGQAGRVVEITLAAPSL